MSLLDIYYNVCIKMAETGDMYRYNTVETKVNNLCKALDIDLSLDLKQKFIELSKHDDKDVIRHHLTYNYVLTKFSVNIPTKTDYDLSTNVKVILNNGKKIVVRD